eukprot:642389-Pyramimonas_sp.AAC.1
MEEKAALAKQMTEEKAALAAQMADEKEALADRLDNELAALELEKAKLAVRHWPTRPSIPPNTIRYGIRRNVPASPRGK